MSNTIKNDLLDIGIPLEKINIIPNAVEIDKFNKLKTTKIKKKNLNLITVARFSEKKKGFDLLPLIALELIESKIDFRWSIIGKNTKKLLENEVIKNNLENFSITEDIIDYDEVYLPSSTLIKKYLESDIHLNLSTIESFGITFVEALASGIPVLSFDTKGVNEIVKHNYNGYLIKDMSIKFIVKKIIEIANDESLITDLEEGVVNSSKLYSLNLITNKFLDLYKVLLK